MDSVGTVMTVGDVLSADDILLDVDATSRRGVFEAVGELFASRYGLNRPQVSNALYAREQLGSTGLGHGVALPHARLSGVEGAVAAYVRTRMPIPFDAPDGKPVSDMIVLIAPRHANEMHLQLLAYVANLFASKEFREQLRACDDAAQVMQLIQAHSRR
jgi:PTS system nitrogen regulatory IIA component